MKFFSYILGFLFLSLSMAHADHYCKSHKKLSVAEQLASLNPKFDLNLVELDLFSHSSVVAGYEYEVEPAYTQGLYSRSDSWVIGLSGIPSQSFDLGSGLNLDLKLGPKYKTEAKFIRFFNDPCAAMLSRRYSPRRMPLKAKNAIGEHFQVGDYFLFRGSVGFIGSAEMLNLLGNTPWGVGVSGSYLIEGFYQLHIVRINESQIRLKVLAHRGQNTGISVGLGYENEFDVFQINALNNQLEKFVNTKPIKIQMDLNKSDVFLVDYVLDLTDPEVIKAFERVVRKVNDYKFMNLIKPFELESSLLLDLSALEELYLSDRQAGNEKRIRRNLRSSSDQDSYGFSLTAGNKLLGAKLESKRSTAEMNVFKEDNTKEFYVLNSWDKKWEGRFLYSWVKSKEEEGTRALFKVNEKFEDARPVNIVKYLNQKKNRFSYKNFLDLKLTLQKALPREVFKKIPWEQWKQKPGEKYKNFGIRFELTMSPESILNAPELSRTEIETQFRNYIHDSRLTERDYFTARPGNRSDRVSPEELFERSLRSMSKNLAMVLNKKLPLLERSEFITKLRSNRIFADSGLGFIMWLSESQLDKWYRLDLDISSNESLIDFSLGDQDLTNLYKKILTVKAALDDDSLDLLREAESLSTVLNHNAPH